MKREKDKDKEKELKGGKALLMFGFCNGQIVVLVRVETSM